MGKRNASPGRADTKARPVPARFQIDCHVFACDPDEGRAVRRPRFAAQIASLLCARGLSPDLRRARSGKPYLAPGLGYSIGISHADTADVFLLANRKYVGVDAETTSRRRTSAQDRRLRAAIACAQDPAEIDIVSMWTLKEAALKMFAVGLAKPMREVRLTSTGAVGVHGGIFYGKPLRLLNRVIGDLTLSIASLEAYGPPSIRILTVAGDQHPHEPCCVSGQASHMSAGSQPSP